MVKRLFLEILLFLGIPVLLHGILNHVLFYILGGFRFKGYLWEDWTILVSLFLGYVVYILYYTAKIESVDSKVTELSEFLNTFKSKLQDSKFPMITEFNVSKNNLDIYECNFRIHKSPQNVVLCNVVGDNKDACYSKSLETIQSILEE